MTHLPDPTDPLGAVLASGGSSLVDERSATAMRQILGGLLDRASAADFAISRVRLAGIDLSEGELAGVLRCRVLIGRLDAAMLGEAEEAAAEPGRQRKNLQALLAFLASGRLAVRSAGLQTWTPDFSVLRGVGRQPAPARAPAQRSPNSAGTPRRSTPTEGTPGRSTPTEGTPGRSTPTEDSPRRSVLTDDEAGGSPLTGDRAGGSPPTGDEVGGSLLTGDPAGGSPLIGDETDESLLPRDVAVVGAHYFGRPPTGGPSLTCILTDTKSVARAAARFDEIWGAGYDVGAVVRQTLERLVGDSPSHG